MSPVTELIDVGVGARLLIDPTTLDGRETWDVKVGDESYKQIQIKSGIYGVVLSDYRGVWLLRTKGRGLTALERNALTS